MHRNMSDSQTNRGSSAKAVACASTVAPEGGNADMFICRYLTRCI